ncbi:hypothetical protein HGRIS_004260 [Hohenbuehelia grisea]|uniref:Uncharacterized protein n=1 Tax=Hohenbuehelia grisea TaxID=104357 RepID=A0ABR3IP92_9AGAR
MAVSRQGRRRLRLWCSPRAYADGYSTSKPSSPIPRCGSPEKPDSVMPSGCLAGVDGTLCEGEGELRDRGDVRVDPGAGLLGGRDREGVAIWTPWPPACLGVLSLTG